MEKKEKLWGKTLPELQEVAFKADLPAYSAKQMADWLYQKKVSSIGEMTNIAAGKREMLSSLYEIGVQPPVKTVTSADGTKKYLFAVKENSQYIESVYIPSKERATLCVSSQIGCKMNCVFCMTGKQGFSGQLTANEILNQVRSVPEAGELTNIVFMGMGEPLDNVEALFKALEILTAPYGYAWSPKRITVSTIGVIPALKRFLEESSCQLAVSLHSPFHGERLSLMPMEKAHPAERIIELLHAYDFSHQRRLSFEYIMFEGLNDSASHAKALAKMLKGLDCRVNLIRFHAIPGVQLRSAGLPKMENFRDLLNRQGITCTVRESRGEDVFAACGMLSGRVSR
ncbi:MAG: 23S rRNA (adenine(2503)-C(2))-methyltransferase RlmN [Tannerella sp.]|jgi:23S rRNA (adenine2503-C2)-methyltransferase|nr:23S rRNA (adenine(2503)-C(2))-methyltransferase RlmN [Tannerella sp.]